jgi:TRAP-type C4-dicarboxylate transport system permease small subunit
MLKLKYVFLSLSAVEFAIGFSNARPAAFFYLGLPLGAILIILFLVTQFLEKESALYDVQNLAAEVARQATAPLGRPQKISRLEAPVNGTFTKAHSH